MRDRDVVVAVRGLAPAEDLAVRGDAPPRDLVLALENKDDAPAGSDEAVPRRIKRAGGEVRVGLEREGPHPHKGENGGKVAVLARGDEHPLLPAERDVVKGVGHRVGRGRAGRREPAGGALDLAPRPVRKPNSIAAPTSGIQALISFAKAAASARIRLIWSGLSGKPGSASSSDFEEVVDLAAVVVDLGIRRRAQVADRSQPFVGELLQRLELRTAGQVRPFAEVASAAVEGPIASSK